MTGPEDDGDAPSLLDADRAFAEGFSDGDRPGHHTDCGLGSTTEEQVRRDLAAEGIDVGNLWIGAFDDLDDSVREDVATLRTSLSAADIVITGYVYDVRTGALRTVDGS